MNLQEAKQTLKALSEGKKIRKPTLREARENLIKADPGIDIRPVIISLQEKNYQKAAKTLFIELITQPQAAEYFMPLLKKLIEKLL